MFFNDKIADKILEDLGYEKSDLDGIIYYTKDLKNGKIISIIPYPYNPRLINYCENVIVTMNGSAYKYSIDDSEFMFYNIIKLISTEKADEYIHIKHEGENKMTKVVKSTKIDINEPVNKFVPFSIGDKITIALNSKQSAEEMFEELGYTREYTENEYSISIVYKEYIEDRRIINYIDFKYRKSIEELSIVVYQTPINLNEEYFEIPYEFNINELMAMIKQVQELEENSHE